MGASGRSRRGAREHARDAIVGDDGPRELLEQEAHDPEREGEDPEERHHLDELADGHGAVRHPPRTQSQHDDRPEVRQGVETWLERGPQATDDEPFATEPVGRAAEALDLARLEAQRLHDERALEALVGDRGDLADAGLRGGSGTLDALACSTG